MRGAVCHSMRTLAIRRVFVALVVYTISIGVVIDFVLRLASTVLNGRSLLVSPNPGWA